MARAARGLTFADVVALGRTLPGVETSTSYGTPSLKVRTKMLCRLKEDGESLALRASFVVRDHLLQTLPGTFYLTDHYRDYPMVLVRLPTVERETLRQLLEDAWRAVAPVRLIRELDASQPSQERT